MDLVEEMASLLAALPNTSLIARVSLTSLSAVAVPCEVGRQEQHSHLLLGQLLRDGRDPVSRARGG